MVRIDFTVDVARSPRDVFAFLADVERLPEWQSSAVESRADRPLAQGSRVVEKRRVMGREIENELEVTAYDPPRRLALKALRGPVRFTVDHELAEEAGSTSLHVVAEAATSRLMRLTHPLLARTADEELRRDFERLKELLESGERA